MVPQLVELKTSVSSSSPFLGFWKSFSKNRMAVVGLFMLATIIGLAVFASVLAPFDPKSSANISSSDIYNPPSAVHWLGTDDAGRDILSSFLFWARDSLIVGFFAAYISVVIGGTIGVVAGFYGGGVEEIFLRFFGNMFLFSFLPFF